MSIFTSARLALLASAVGMACASLPALAASSASSAASDSVGTLSGSVSGSVEKSSDSSTAKKVAQGDYRVVAVATAQPGMVRMTLQAEATPGEAGLLYLTLPLQAYERSALSAGQKVWATERPYGVEFARSDTRQAFFLALDDAWFNQLGARPVV